MSIEVSGLTVQDAGRTAVQAVSFTLRAGAVTAVIGANGAGKSELVLGMAGALPITSGTMSLNGESLQGLAQGAIRRRGIAAIPEGHRVFTDLSVDDNLRAAGALLLRADLTACLSDTYEIFPELAQRKGQLAGTLSGGQQQMVALAHALMCRPKYLLIDEMSLGLAPLIVKRLLGVVRDLAARGVGILLIEQFTDLALGIAETAVVLRNGKMRYSGPAAPLRDDPSALHNAYFGEGS